MSKLFRCAVASHDPEQAYITTMYFHEPSDDGHPLDLVNHFVGDITTKLKATLVTTGTLDSVTAEEVPAAYGTGGDEATAAIGVAGTYNPGSGPNLPRELCGLIRLKTNFSARGAHGWRFGFPIWQPGSLDAHGVNIVAGSNYQLGLATMKDAFTDHVISGGLDYAPACYSRTYHREGRPNYWFAVTAAVPQVKAHTLRKRNLFS